MINFIFESSSFLKNVCTLLRRITLLLNMSRISIAGWLLFMPQNYYKLFQMNLFFGIWRRKNTETLVGDLISSCYYSMEVVIVRIVVISESKSDKCDLWDKQYVRIQGRTVIISWMVNADAESEERNDYDSSSHFFTDETWLIGIQWHKVGMITFVHS